MNTKRNTGIVVLIAAALLLTAFSWFLITGGRGRMAEPTEDKLYATQTSMTGQTASRPERGVREAMFYKKLPDRAVKCQLCFRYCIIEEGDPGVCKVRENRRGVLYTLVYGEPSAVHIDPIEKEPQYHHLPGTDILCIGTVGCNFICLHCHNWTLSQARPGERPVYDFPPEEVIRTALARNLPIISFTYNDPIVCYEYVFDVAKLARKNGIRVILHTNGAINHEPLMAIIDYIDAFTVDIKGFSSRAYANSSAQLQPVLNTLKTIREQGVWLELVYLVIPTINNSPEEIRQMSRWVVDNLGADVPIHFSRFFPNFRLRDIAATPVRTIEMAREIALSEGVRFSTIGNVPGHRYNSTFCPECDLRLIHRVHFEVVYNKIENGRCSGCNEVIPGLWQ
ncbi:MAG TPA: AmmeMemoRadiSam system radical SAM enzyme [Bacteroidales bacterium]|nr:AmmeMemoRadiSam system radical SAM enzyme [Bacteroidales bacterium]